MKGMHRLLNYIPSPAIVFITGRRGSGKTAKAFSLATAMHNKYDKPVYCEKPRGVWLPSYFYQIDIRNPNNNSIWLLDDAHILLYAREWWEEPHKLMDVLQSISRHKNIDIIYTTQQTVRIDKNIIAGVDAIIFTEPSLLSPQFERTQIIKFVKEANRIFRNLHPKDKKRTAYIITHEHKIILKNIKLPYYWSKSLSKSFSSYNVLEKKREKRPVLIIKSI